jgi:hypothetical protein
VQYGRSVARPHDRRRAHQVSPLHDGPLFFASTVLVVVQPVDVRLAQVLSLWHLRRAEPSDAVVHIASRTSGKWHIGRDE